VKDFWTTPEGKSLHLELARLAGATGISELASSAWWPIEAGSWLSSIGAEPFKSEEKLGLLIADIPPAHNLIRQLESGLNEEQLENYAKAITNNRESISAFVTTMRWTHLGNCIRCPDETRARALVEVLP
jgi:hypothetical protein